METSELDYILYLTVLINLAFMVIYLKNYLKRLNHIVKDEIYLTSLFDIFYIEWQNFKIIKRNI